MGALDFESDAFLTLAVRGGVAPLLYATLRSKEVLPPTMEVGLRASYLAQAGQNLLAFHELAGVLHALQEAGIDVLVLKGAALAETLYGNPGVRPMCDVDLLISPEAVPAALARLRGLGYAGGEREARAGDKLAYENEVMLRKETGTPAMALEVHWSLFDSPHHQRLIPLTWFWETARAAWIQGAEARVLGTEAQLLHLCGHLLLHHGSGEDLRLLWLHDIAELLACRGAEVDWDRLFLQACAFDLVLPLQQIVPDVAARWAVPLPADVLPRLARLRSSPAEARVFEWLTAPERSAAQRFVADMAALPDGPSRLRFAGHNLFPSFAYMRERYRVKAAWWVPLAYPYRWFIGVWGWVTRRRS
jgi:hypothetical protein